MGFITMSMIYLAIIVTMWHYYLGIFIVVSRELLCVFQSIITQAFIKFMVKKSFHRAFVVPSSIFWSILHSV